MVKVEYNKRGETVFYYNNILLKPVETIVLDVHINVPDVGEHTITYTLEAPDKKSASLKLNSKQVFNSKELLKEAILKGFESENVEVS